LPSNRDLQRNEEQVLFGGCLRLRRYVHCLSNVYRLCINYPTTKPCGINYINPKPNVYRLCINYLTPKPGRGCGVKRGKQEDLVNIRSRMGQKGTAVLICAAHAASEAARRGYMGYENSMDENGVPIPKNGTAEFKHPDLIEKKMCRACWQQNKTNGIREGGKVQAGALRTYERCALGNAFSVEYFKRSLNRSFWNIILSDYAQDVCASMVNNNWEWLLAKGLTTNAINVQEMGKVVQKMAELFSTDGIIDSRHVCYAKLVEGTMIIDLPSM
jgi:hypothetical protein